MIGIILMAVVAGCGDEPARRATRESFGPPGVITGNGNGGFRPPSFSGSADNGMEHTTGTAMPGEWRSFRAK